MRLPVHPAAVLFSLNGPAEHRPAAYAGLQAVDYFLWALQRMYERTRIAMAYVAVRTVGVDSTLRRTGGWASGTRRKAAIARLWGGNQGYRATPPARSSHCTGRIRPRP